MTTVALCTLCIYQRAVGAQIEGDIDACVNRAAVAAEIAAGFDFTVTKLAHEAIDNRAMKTAVLAISLLCRDRGIAREAPETAYYGLLGHLAEYCPLWQPKPVLPSSAYGYSVAA